VQRGLSLSAFTIGHTGLIKMTSNFSYLLLRVEVEIEDDFENMIDDCEDM
jgi:hypothetical protein